jgi:hypothetical protein
VTALIPGIDRLRRFAITIVADQGMISAETLAES